MDQLRDLAVGVGVVVGSAFAVWLWLKRTTGAQRAGFAANGVGLDGSAADTIFDTTEEGALDVAAIRWNSKLASDNLNYKAKLSDMNAGIAKASAIPAFLSPVIGGLAQMSSSFS